MEPSLAQGCGLIERFYRDTERRGGRTWRTVPLSDQYLTDPPQNWEPLGTLKNMPRKSLGILYIDVGTLSETPWSLGHPSRVFVEWKADGRKDEQHGKNTLDFSLNPKYFLPKF